MPKTWDHKDRPYRVIGRGWVGWHAEAVDLSSSRGTLDGYVKEAADGCLVYDAKEADKGAFARLIMRGPMVKCDLVEKEIKPFEEVRASAEMLLPSLSGGFETVTARALAEKPTLGGYSSLDYVSVSIYERLLRQVPGIKIGHVKDGQVEWEKP